MELSSPNHSSGNGTAEASVKETVHQKEADLALLDTEILRQ